MVSVEEDLFETDWEAGVQDLQIKLIYSYFRSKEYDSRSDWVETVEDDINAFLDGKTVYSFEMEFASEDKNRIYGNVLYTED